MLDITHDEYRRSTYTEGVTNGSNNLDYRTRRGDIASTDNEKEARRIYTDIGRNSDANFPPVKRMNGSAWSPMIALSYDLTDNSRLHLRWAQMTRFPSIYETTNMSAGAVYKYPMLPSIDLKPERSTNWEIGYTYNFAPLWSRLREGDVRLTYYSNKIKNQIDTSNMDGGMIQYDKAISKGVELQSRLDSGRFFASFGGTYRLKHMVCDKGIAFKFDYYLQRVPECLEGGFGLSRFFQSLQPKYSLTLDVGTRFFNEKLELGMRAIHHSKAERKNYDKLIADGAGQVYERNGKPYGWHAATLLDAYARYRIGKHIDLNFGVTNLANRYYLDPMSSTPVPGPGRTITFGIKGKF